MSSSKTLLTLALCASVVSGGAAQAFPGSQSTRAVATAAATDTAPLVQEARYRGYRGGYYRGGRGWGRGAIGLGIAGAVIGSAIIANESYRYRRYGGGASARQACADRFQSFDWDSGTYMGYDGVRHVCPYL